ALCRGNRQPVPYTAFSRLTGIHYASESGVFTPAVRRAPEIEPVTRGFAVAALPTELPAWAALVFHLRCRLLGSSNTTPSPELPPLSVVPHRFPTASKFSLPSGALPSLPL